MTPENAGGLSNLFGNNFDISNLLSNLGGGNAKSNVVTTVPKSNVQATNKKAAPAASSKIGNIVFPTTPVKSNAKNAVKPAVKASGKKFAAPKQLVSEANAEAEGGNYSPITESQNNKYAPINANNNNENDGSANGVPIEDSIGSISINPDDTNVFGGNNGQFSNLNPDDSLPIQGY